MIRLANTKMSDKQRQVGYSHELDLGCYNDTAQQCGLTSFRVLISRR